MAAEKKKQVREMTKEQRSALELYLTGEYTQKNIADILGKSEKTVSSWAKQFEWKKQLAMRSNAPAELESNIIEILAELAIATKAEKSNTMKAALADQAAKWNKTLALIRKDSRISLGASIELMKDFMAFVQARKPSLVKEMVPLQKDFIILKSKEYL